MPGSFRGREFGLVGLEACGVYGEGGLATRAFMRFMGFMKFMASEWPGRLSGSDCAGVV